MNMVWSGLVRSPDPLADGSDFFKVRRGPCLGYTSQHDFIYPWSKQGFFALFPLSCCLLVQHITKRARVILPVITKILRF